MQRDGEVQREAQRETERGSQKSTENRKAKRENIEKKKTKRETKGKAKKENYAIALPLGRTYYLGQGMRRTLSCYRGQGMRDNTVISARECAITRPPVISPRRELSRPFCSELSHGTQKKQKGTKNIKKKHPKRRKPKEIQKATKKQQQ